MQSAPVRFLREPAMEASLLGSRDAPRYTFLGTGDPPQRTGRRFRCCVSGLLIALLMLTLAIVIWYFLTPGGGPGGPPANAPDALDGLLGLSWPLTDEKYSDSTVEPEEEKRAFGVGVNGLKEKDGIEEFMPAAEKDSPVFRHRMATYTSDEAQRMARLGYVLNLGAKEMKKCADATHRSPGKPTRWPLDWSVGEQCSGGRVNCTSSPYRSANGTCNNLGNKTWGAALRPFRRILLPQYEDGISEPRLASDGSALPSAREISLAVHRPAYKSDRNFTVMLAVWGQFIDHDITATAISKGKNGSLDCCRTALAHPECFPVPLSQTDPFYVRYNVSCMDFVRSAPAPTCAFGPREQLNQVTSFLDASVVYGNSDEETNQLRTFAGGQLRMLQTSSGDLLPVSEDPGDGCNRREEFRRGRYCFLSGDGRANENVLLTAMHLLFARQHNLIAKGLSGVNPHWTDERLFQETRKIIAAQIQHVTYTEFLSAVLPDALLTRANISTRRSGYSDAYDPSVDPTVSNVFAAAAFRFGHSLLPGLLRVWKNASGTPEYVRLHKMLFDPFKLFQREYLEGVVRGAIDTSPGKPDVYFSEEVTQKLFQGHPDGPCGLDLVTLNIQRGRDHGLAGYPKWRGVCGLRPVEGFDDLRGEMEEEVLGELKRLYRSVNDVDVYTGGLAERPVRGGMVGPTISCLLTDQFLRLKIGDRFWYETGEDPQRFTEGQLTEIRKTSLAGIICGASGVGRSQANVMRAAGVGNEVRPCGELPSPDLSAWRDPQAQQERRDVESRSANGAH